MSSYKNSKDRGQILVTGIGGPAGRAATRYLHQKGYAVIGTDMETNHFSPGVFIKVPAASNPDFIETVLKIVIEKRVTLIIPTVSEELPLFARHKSEFTAHGCLIMIGSYQAVNIVNDKLKTARFLKQVSLATPRTLTSDITHTKVCEVLGLPVIAKPCVSRGGRGVKLYSCLEELQQEHRKNILYQQFVSGEEYNVNLYINHHGDMKSCVVLRKTKLREGMVGNALSVERTEHKEVALLGWHACNAIGLVGPVDIDIRLDETGLPLLLEINARLGANALSASEVLDELIVDWQRI